jgi:hypothetical protein
MLNIGLPTDLALAGLLRLLVRQYGIASWALLAAAK